MGQNSRDIGQGLGRRAAGEPRAIQGGHGRGPGLRLDAMQQDLLALGSKGLNGRGGIGQDEEGGSESWC